MKKLYLFGLILAIFGAWLLWCDSGTGWTEHAKNWIREDEFNANGELWAKPKHTVILQLEKGDSKVRNSIPYVFEERGDYNFCIDEDDPLIDSMKLVNAGGITVAHMNKKKRCVTKTIPKGRYTMHVYHDGRAVGDSIQYAFVHQKKASLPLGKNNPWAGPSAAAAQKGEKPPRSSIAGAVGDDLPSGGYWTVEASNGKALRSNVMSQGSRQTIVTTGATDIPILRFFFGQVPYPLPKAFGCQSLGYDAKTCTFVADSSYEPHLSVWFFDDPSIHLLCPDLSPDSDYCLHYYLGDLGDYNFQILGYFWYLGCDETRDCSDFTIIVVNKEGALDFRTYEYCSWSPDPWNCTIFTLAAINDVPAAQVPADSLQKGQAALYDQPDCSGTATLVMPGNHELEAGAASVRMPHGTRITLYQQGTGKKIVLNGGPGCINVGAGFVVESMTIEYTKDILMSTKKCRYCDLYGLPLQNMTLDGFDFSYAYLANTRFSNSSMKGVNLSHTVLAGAQLDKANLQGSNLCNAFLQGNVEIASAANLDGAYLKNVNLSGANLSGVSMINTAFYNTGASPCAACCDPDKVYCGSDPKQTTSTCATAYNATMDGTQATPAYLARTDFSSIKTTGANFSGSILVGANFSNAQLHTDVSSTARTNFAHAFLQGADFTSASVDNASFSGAYVDLNPQQHLGFQLPGFYTQFNGFWSTPGSSICVDGLNPIATKVPTTTGSNICPDGSLGPCSNAAWTYYSTKLDQADPKAGYGLCPCDPFANCGDKTWPK